MKVEHLEARRHERRKERLQGQAGRRQVEEDVVLEEDRKSEQTGAVNQGHQSGLPEEPEVRVRPESGVEETAEDAGILEEAVAAERVRSGNERAASRDDFIDAVALRAARQEVWMNPERQPGHPGRYEG